MSKLETAWKWIVRAAVVVGSIILYVLLTKDDTDKKVEALENEIKDIDKDIKKKAKEREILLADADEHGKVGKKLDKQIEKAKKKKRNIGDKRTNMKNIFDKYAEKANANGN